MEKTIQKRSYRRSESEIWRMIRLYHSGLSMEQVGEQFGISKQRVEQIFRKLGVETRRHTKTDKFLEGHKKRIKILPKELLVKYYKDEKLPVGEIIKSLKTSSSMFYKSLEFHNIPKRITEGTRYSSLTEDVLRRLYLDEDLSSTEIATRLDYSSVTIRKRLSAYGIRKGDRIN
ncbi:MAG: hypothetical protein WA584_02070 [Pyrinomonadaceae bacterium]